MKSHKMYQLRNLFLIILVCSCSSYPDSVENALRQAGDNRVELEKVLEHYSVSPSDSLKLNAAMFLIENMPWHYGYGGQYMDEYVRRIDSCFSSLPMELRMALYTLPEEFPALSNRIEIKPDVQTITAEFLIHNIDLSFKLWHESYWLRELSFDNFCEYLLPYRLGREPLIHWKDSLTNSFKKLLRDGTENLLSPSTDAYGLYKFLHYHLMRSEEYCFRQYSIPDAEIGNYQIICDRSSMAYAYLWRMCGIPTAVDFFPRHGNGNNLRHSEITIIDERLRGGVTKEQYYYAAKVYRTTFSVNRMQILSPSKDFVPEVAQNPFYKDVTASYSRTADVSIETKGRPQHLYLGVFSLGWDAAAHAPVKRGKATFKDMGVGVVYMPFYYSGNRQVFVSDPFYLDVKGNLNYFHADKNNTQTITLERKYPIADYKIWWTKMFENGRFEWAKDAQFTHPQLIFRITENTFWRTITIPVDSSINARYYRFRNYGYPIDLAELHFYDTNGEEVKGKCIADPTTIKNPDLPNIFDGDRLSFTLIHSWVGVEFGSDVSLGSIEYTPRNDANGIYPGMVYELLFFDKCQWTSMGIKTATDYSITYEGVPSNALLWLRNLTEGKEERIFIYQNGKQRWL